MKDEENKILIVSGKSWGDFNRYLYERMELFTPEHPSYQEAYYMLKGITSITYKELNLNSLDENLKEKLTKIL